MHDMHSFQSPMKRKDVFADLMTPPQFDRGRKLQKTDISPQSHQTFASRHETRISPLNDIFGEMECETSRETDIPDVCKVVEVVFLVDCTRQGVAILRSWTVQDLIREVCKRSSAEMILQDDCGNIVPNNLLASVLEVDVVYYICDVANLEKDSHSSDEPFTTLEIIDLSGTRVGLPISAKWLVSDILAALSVNPEEVRFFDDASAAIAVDTKACELCSDVTYTLCKKG